MKLRDWLNLGVRVGATVFLLGLMAREQAKDLVRRKRRPNPFTSQRRESRSPIRSWCRVCMTTDTPSLPGT